MPAGLHSGRVWRNSIFWLFPSLVDIYAELLLKLKIHERAFSYIRVGCGPEIDNTVRSPGYPNSYPPDTDCFSWVPIPQGMAMDVSFNDFELEDSESCR